MNVIIVEDEEKQQSILKRFLNEYLGEKKVAYSVEAYFDGESFLKDYKKGDADLIFMDIELGANHLNGMEISKKIREIDCDVLLIFVTNMAQFAIEGYSVDALDFVVKPLLYEPFKMKMEKTFKVLLTRKNLKNVLISVDNGSKRIIASEIVYVEVANHDVYYHTKNGEYKNRSSMKKVIKELEGLPFSQCNSCYLVNLAFVERVEKDQVVLSTNEALKMPRTRRKEFLLELGNYFSGVGE